MITFKKQAATDTSSVLRRLPTIIGRLVGSPLRSRGLETETSVYATRVFGIADFYQARTGEFASTRRCETRFVSKARVVPDKYSTQVSRRFFYYRMETDECPGASSSMAGSNCEITDSERERVSE